MNTLMQWWLYCNNKLTLFWNDTMSSFNIQYFNFILELRILYFYLSILKWNIWYAVMLFSLNISWTLWSTRFSSYTTTESQHVAQIWVKQWVCGRWLSLGAEAELPLIFPHWLTNTHILSHTHTRARAYNFFLKKGCTTLYQTKGGGVQTSVVFHWNTFPVYDALNRKRWKDNRSQWPYARVLQTLRNS